MKIVIIGKGKMGKELIPVALEQKMEIVGQYDSKNIKLLKELNQKVDLVIDFSSPDSLVYVLEYIKKNKINYLCGTTGLDFEQQKKLVELSLDVAVLYGANFCLFLNLLKEFFKDNKYLLNDLYEITIIEEHHKYKKDQPSGTALMIKDSLHIENKIDILSVRKQEIIGNHEIVFYGKNDIIRIKHEGLSRKLYAQGAIDLGKKLVTKSKGYYSVEQLLLER